MIFGKKQEGPYTLYVEHNDVLSEQGTFSERCDVQEAAEDWLCDFLAVEIVESNGQRTRVTQEQKRRDKGVYL